MRNLICGWAALAALLLAARVPARANIGDTLADLRKHYGSAKDLGGQMLFEVRLKDGQIIPARDSKDKDVHYSITVYFDGSSSAMEVFTRNTSDPAKANMTPEDISAILAAVGRGIPWYVEHTKSGKPTWTWGDQKGGKPKLMARYDAAETSDPKDASVLIIMEYTER